MGKKKKTVKKRGKRIRKGRKHEATKLGKFYEIKEGKVHRKGKPCPRCGPGTWFSEHKGRSYCGRCGYTEFKKK